MPMDVLQVGTCRAAEIFADPAAAALFEEYGRECANPLLGPLAPQPEMYASLEELGIAKCVGAYRNGYLCGFAFVLISAIPHYGRKFASVESLFVAREAREGILPAKLMQAVEDHALEAGCHAIFYSAPVRSRLAVMLFKHEDKYANTNHIFCRRLA